MDGEFTEMSQLMIKSVTTSQCDFTILYTFFLFAFIPIKQYANPPFQMGKNYKQMIDLQNWLLIDLNIETKARQLHALQDYV